MNLFNALCASFAVALVTSSSAVQAQEAKPAPAVADEQQLAQQLKDETERTQQLAAELKVIESAPLQTAPEATAPKPEAKPAAKVEEVPASPVAGSKEEFANALYALKKYGQARAIYQEIADANPRSDTLTWAHMQVANCARNQGDLIAAVSAYKRLLNEHPESPWAKEATWWTAELNWWLLWNETMKRETAPSAPIAAAR